MPKECRRKSSKDFGFSGTGISDGGRVERRAAGRSPQICAELIQKAAIVAAPPAAPALMDAPLVPQVTITSDAGGTSREIQEEDLDGAVDGTLRRKLSNSSISSNGSSAVESEDDLLSDTETQSKGLVTLEHLVCAEVSESKAWKKLKTYIRWPLQASQKKKVNWVQLAGHKGNFKAAEEGTILKKLSENEKKCFEDLQNDVLVHFVPRYQGIVENDGEFFVQMTDLLAGFNHPNVMDCKMGLRTYLEEELVRARERPKLREDLYKKMMEVDREGPSPQEHFQRGITKPCYMQWRDSMSSTNTLGFRIEGIKKYDGTCRTDFKKTRSKQDIIKLFKEFVEEDVSIIMSYLERLREIREALRISDFFKKHEVIGSSLLFIHVCGRANVWMIDFGKTSALPEGQTLRHDLPWQEGNREDGYLLGLENLILTLEAACNEGSGEETKNNSLTTARDF
ncbi:inositol-trisphosphate 3-kinase A isoform X1 [Poecilia reticulata]|uniref:inositol-trisphosphate 3-kinase A isoform X1 n=1 Tax=Poecilia reticulata TaxID=8081 RepID=UPI0004A4F0E5|nr:PREDICTED: inositol-trisphosphate 3-kinase A isoform X1 [Poecilia reticulata]